MASVPPPGFLFPLGTKFDPVAFAAVMNRRGHPGHIGLRYHAHSDAWIELALPWREDLVGVVGSGLLASGPIISLLDNVTSMSVWHKRGVFAPQVTLDLRVDYMRPARPGQTVIARGQCYQLKRQVAFVRGLAHDGDPDDPVAHVAGTFMLMGKGE